MAEIYAAIACLAAQQFGVLSMKQVEQAGGNAAFVYREVDAGRLTVEAHGVFGIPGYPDSFERRCWVGRLALGGRACLGHEGAAKAHGFEGFGMPIVSFIVPNGANHRVEGVVARQSRDLFEHPHHMTTWIGLEITTGERTLVDLAANPAYRVRIRHAFDEGYIASKRFTVKSVHDVAAELAGPGKRGIREIEAVLGAYRAGDGVPGSDLEVLLVKGCDAFLHRRPDLQAPHPGRDLPNCCSDGRFVPELVIAEVDGRTFHDRRAQRARDNHRDREAARFGEQTLRFVHEDMVNDLKGCMDDLAATLAVRRRQFGL